MVQKFLGVEYHCIRCILKLAYELYMHHRQDCTSYWNGSVIIQFNDSYVCEENTWGYRAFLIDSKYMLQRQHLNRVH